MSIENLLVLSTSHLDPSTAASISAGVTYGLDMLSRDDSWAFFTCLPARDKPECINNIVQYAAERCCTMICLDCDGDVIDELETWEL